MDRVRAGKTVVGAERLYHAAGKDGLSRGWYLASVYEFCPVRRLVQPWHYREIVPLKRILYIHNLADKDGNKLDPRALGMPQDFPQDQRHTVTFRGLPDGKTEMTVIEHEWPAGQMMEMSRMGLGQCLDKMAASFAKSKVER